MSNTKILVGSHAARHWFNDFREPGDVDYLVKGDLKGEARKIEYHNVLRGDGLVNLFDSAAQSAILMADPLGGETIGLTAEQLYTLKLSHSFWNINWDKTMFDINFYQKKKVVEDEVLFSSLYKDWVKIHGPKKARLKRPNEDFFTAAVSREFPHDSLHEAIAYYERPLFETVKYDKSQAYVEEELFLQLSDEDKLRLCREEIYVTALERFLIPKKFCYSTLAAYRGACRLLITSMSKGWFPKFIVLNWQTLNKPDNHPFVKLFKEKLWTLQ